MKKKIEKLEAFPPNSNPFNYDLYHMGVCIDKTHLVMFSEFNENKEMILIHIPSGKRVKLNLKEIFK